MLFAVNIVTLNSLNTHSKFIFLYPIVISILKLFHVFAFILDETALRVRKLILKLRYLWPSKFRTLLNAIFILYFSL